MTDELKEKRILITRGIQSDFTTALGDALAAKGAAVIYTEQSPFHESNVAAIVERANVLQPGDKPFDALVIDQPSLSTGGNYAVVGIVEQLAGSMPIVIRDEVRSPKVDFLPFQNRADVRCHTNADELDKVVHSVEDVLAPRTAGREGVGG